MATTTTTTTPLPPPTTCRASTLALRTAMNKNSKSLSTNQSDCVCCAAPNSPTAKFKHDLKVKIPNDIDYLSDAETLSPSSPSDDGYSLPVSPTGSPTTEPAADATVELPHEYLNEMFEQSPIDIVDMESHPVVLVPGSVTVSHSATPAQIVHCGSNFEVRWQSKDRNTLTIDGKVFYAVQFHFHTPSEHTIDGKAEAMELHMVHQADDGNLAVVALFFREGAANQFLEQFWHELPGMDATTNNSVSVGSIDPRHLDLLSGLFFRYKGSLTTPPYTEGVEWIVVRDVAEASREQIQTFIDTLPSANARPVQPLNKRRVSIAH